MLGNLLYLQEYNYNPVWYFSWVIFGIAYMTGVWELSLRWVHFTRNRFPDNRQSLLRIIITFAGYFTLTILCQILFVFLTDATGVALVPVTRKVYVSYILVGIICSLLLGTIYEIIFYLQQYRQAIAEAEAVQKAGIQSQFDSLKNQVNPHFLFNSLNSLSALISEDRARANQFLDELSTVYRYLLQSGERRLVTVQTEIDFIHSFFYLLKARYGAAIELKIAIDVQLLDAWLPPFSLQTLVENAIRHNIILAEKPLVITIHTTQDSALAVKNNIQRKNLQVNKQPGGLGHLTERFTLLRLPRPLITDDGREFVVRLPLIVKGADFLVNLP
ncbi:sensor histidine kinase [Larkinella soli]|uniref:sensor histidine kinase n=1 Tax=Larkinella soli TaxID=1770527 RepID=UPI0019D06BA6|nr:histidine kinase [Larkinella soli]